MRIFLIDFCASHSMMLDILGIVRYNNYWRHVLRTQMQGLTSGQRMQDHHLNNLDSLQGWHSEQIVGFRVKSTKGELCRRWHVKLIWILKLMQSWSSCLQFACRATARVPLYSMLVTSSARILLPLRLQTEAWSEFVLHSDMAGLSVDSCEWPLSEAYQKLRSLARCLPSVCTAGAQGTLTLGVEAVSMML